MILLPKLISDEIEAMLNKAVLHEYTNGHIYFGMSSYFSKVGFNSAAEVLQNWGEEEHTHATKVKEYIDDRNGKIIIPALDKPLIEFTGMGEILTKVFEREVDTEKVYNILSAKALRDNDRPTFEFCTWFINEQREEIVKARKLIDSFNLIGEDNPNMKHFMEEEFKDLLG